MCRCPCMKAKEQNSAASSGTNCRRGGWGYRWKPGRNRPRTAACASGTTHSFYDLWVSVSTKIRGNPSFRSMNIMDKIAAVWRRTWEQPLCTRTYGPLFNAYICNRTHAQRTCHDQHARASSMWFSPLTMIDPEAAKTLTKLSAYLTST